MYSERKIVDVCQKSCTLIGSCVLKTWTVEHSGLVFGHRVHVDRKSATQV